MRPLKLPNFILAGAPTSGTTSLYHYLCQHPQIYMCPIKEPTFFAADDILARADLKPMLERQRPALQAYLEGRAQRREQVWVTEWEDYVRLFQDARDHIAIGEASVSYLWLPSAAPAIRRRLPDAKIIFLLRDPTERLYSSYLQTLQTGHNLTFREWVLQGMQMVPDRRNGMSPHPIALDGGFYATHLNHFLELFSREQVRVFLFEDYQADVTGTLKNIFDYLGVDPHQQIDVSRRHNVTQVPRFSAVHRLKNKWLKNTSLTGWLPGPASGPLRQFFHHDKQNFKLDPDDRLLVVDYYRDEIGRAQDLIGRDLSAWLR